MIKHVLIALGIVGSSAAFAAGDHGFDRKGVRQGKLGQIFGKQHAQKRLGKGVQRQQKSTAQAPKTGQSGTVQK